MNNKNSDNLKLTTRGAVTEVPQQNDCSVHCNMQQNSNNMTNVPMQQSIHDSVDQQNSMNEHKTDRLQNANEA